MSNQDKKVLLEIHDLQIEGYTGEVWVPIIKGVDLTLHRGEVMGLIGESGAGKSTIGAGAETSVSRSSLTRSQKLLPLSSVCICAMSPPILCPTKTNSSSAGDLSFGSRSRRARARSVRNWEAVIQNG